jgi:hypothetical protein
MFINWVPDTDEYVAENAGRGRQAPDQGRYGARGKPMLVFPNAMRRSDGAEPGDNLHDRQDATIGRRVFPPDDSIAVSKVGRCPWNSPPKIK